MIHLPEPLSAAAVLQRVARLPALPQAVLALQATLHDEHASIAECAGQIRRDAALTARMLRLANSAFYGVPGRVASVDDAIHLIGVRPLRALATTAAVSLQFEPPPPDALGHAGFWRHTLAAAHAAQALAEALGLDDETAYTAALLHDIGRLALAVHFPDAMRAWLPGTAAERAALGIDHAEVGAAIARHWHLPEAVAEAIASHHRPPPAERATLVDVVHVADALAHRLGHGHEARHEPATDLPGEAHDSGAWQRVRPEAMALDALLVRTREAVEAACESLGLTEPAPAAAQPHDESLPCRC